MKIERTAIAVQSDEVDTAFAEYSWMPAGNNQPVARSKAGKVTTFWILCVCSWSVFETWAEIGTATDNLRLCAVLVAKLIWLLVGRAAIYDSRTGRTIFAFLCGVSVLAVASALPTVYVISKSIFILLLVECLLKTSCLLALGGKCSKGYYSPAKDTSQRRQTAGKDVGQAYQRPEHQRSTYTKRGNPRECDGPSGRVRYMEISNE